VFQYLKDEVPLLKGIAHFTGKDFSAAGSNTLELEDKACPFCKHNDCFRIKLDPDTGDGLLYRCFSCSETGNDTVQFYSTLFQVAKPKEAAELVAKEFGLTLPEVSSNIHQEIFEVAARYYHHNLLSSKEHLLHDDRGYTPLRYQIDVRKHSQDILEKECVGWSDDGFQDYMDSLGYREDHMLACGLLVKNTEGKIRSFFGSGAFIYPHFVDGKVSHFTQKTPDRIKGVKYQLRNEHRLNGYRLYGQDDIEQHTKVFIVEGENDRLTLKEFVKGKAAVVAIIGQISRQQLDWINVKLKSKTHVYTIFDNDDAGDKYRVAVAALGMAHVIQCKAPDPYKDVDEYLCEEPGASLDGLVIVGAQVDTQAAKVSDGAAPDARKGIAARNVFEQGNCYYRMQVDKKGNQEPVKVSNFSMHLKNVFVRMSDQTREREVVITREDGSVGSSNLFVNSDVKTRLLEFKRAVADAADVTFYGTESDLQMVWDWVYSRETENTILVSTEVGHQSDSNTWLFRDGLIQSDGMIIPAREDELIPMGDYLLMPHSTVTQSTGKRSNKEGIPRIFTPTTRNAVEDVAFRNGFYDLFLKNIGDVGVAVTMLAWMKACAFSDYLFERYHFFPFLYIWGKHAQGKSAVAGWLLQLYGMGGIGEMTLPRLGSGVGFNRMMATYASLPILLDEMRADRTAAELHGPIRSWYNRVPRVMGSKEDTASVVSQPVRSCVMFCGQDILTDVAARSRCIEVEIPHADKRDLVHSYQWIEHHLDELPAIGRGWILEALNTDMRQLIYDIQGMEQMLVAATHGDTRVCRQWAMVGIFADHILSDLGLDTYPLEAFLINSCKGKVEEQEEDSLILRFFNMVEGVQVQPNSPINGEHIRTSGDKVLIWVTDLYRIIAREKEMSNNSTTFSTKALMAALKAEPWYVTTEARPMGMHGANRRVVILKNEESLPNVLKSIIATVSG